MILLSESYREVNRRDKASALFSTYTSVNSLSYSSAYDVVVLDRLESTSVEILCYWSWLLINLFYSFQHLNYKLNLDFDFNWTCTHFFKTWKHNWFDLIFFHPWMTKQYKPICYNTSPSYTMSYQTPKLNSWRMFTHVHLNTWNLYKSVSYTHLTLPTKRIV